MRRSSQMPSQPPIPADDDLFRQIVRAGGKEHLNLAIRVVRQPGTGIETFIVSGSAYAAGYQQGTTWPDLFRQHLESGLFG